MTTPTSTLLRAAADDIECLEGELEDARERVARAASLEAETVRLAYRRGYYAGHAAGRNGRARESAPERHSRSLKALVA